MSLLRQLMVCLYLPADKDQRELLCAVCDIVFSSAWDLCQHCQQEHGIAIFKETQVILYVSCFEKKMDFCLCENKDADQLCSNCTADQCLCIRYVNSTFPLLQKSEISSLKPVSVTVQSGL